MQNAGANVPTGGAGAPPPPTHAGRATPPSGQSAPFGGPPAPFRGLIPPGTAPLPGVSATPYCDFYNDASKDHFLGHYGAAYDEFEVPLGNPLLNTPAELASRYFRPWCFDVLICISVTRQSMPIKHTYILYSTLECVEELAVWQ